MFKDRDQREKTLRRVALKCADFTRQFSYHRALDKYKNDFFQNFWIIMYNNAIDLAVLDWFHLFGYHNDDLHWKKIVDNVNDFRFRLLLYLKIDEAVWRDYHKIIKEYRDKDVAHIEIRPVSIVPEMTIALKATNYYYLYVLKELSNYGNYSNWPDDLIEYHEKSLKQSIDIVSVAYEATRSMNEKVF